MSGVLLAWRRFVSEPFWTDEDWTETAEEDKEKEEEEEEGKRRRRRRRRGRRRRRKRRRRRRKKVQRLNLRNRHWRSQSLFLSKQGKINHSTGSRGEGKGGGGYRQSSREHVQGACSCKQATRQEREEKTEQKRERETRGQTRTPNP